VALTSKSPKAVLKTALAVARRAWPAYSHRNSPKKFTQHQLFACLVLKNFLKADYRGVVAHLRDAPSLAEAIDLQHVPHFTTLQKAAARLLVSADARRLLDSTETQPFLKRAAAAASPFRARLATRPHFFAGSGWLLVRCGHGREAHHR